MTDSIWKTCYSCQLGVICLYWEEGKKGMSENNFERICKVLISRVTLNDAKREKESKKTWSSALAALTSSRVENRCAARHTHMLTHISLGCLTCLFYQVHQLSPALSPPPGLQVSVCPPQLLFNWLVFLFFYQQDAPTLQNLRFILLLQFKKNWIMWLICSLTPEQIH